MFMRGLEIEEAVELLKRETTPVSETETVGLLEAVGRVCMEEVRAVRPQPPFHRSPLDGYALKAADTVGASRQNPVTLRVADKIMAGSVSEYRLSGGDAVRLMTGAPIPEGADCVIRQEDTDYGEEQVRIYGELKPYENFCRIGEDYREGEVLLARGDAVDASVAGILAGAGFSQLRVARPVRVALITSGDEVIQPGEEWRPGKIYNSNAVLIAGRLKELGFSPVFTAHGADSAEEMKRLIRRAAETADLILTTGGVSVGEKDILHEVAEDPEVKKLFWRLAMKPGSPVMSFLYRETPVIALSGNPFGAFTALETLVRPVLAHLASDSRLEPEQRLGTMTVRFSKASRMRRLIRGVWKDGAVTIPESGHSSGILSSMKGCNCLIDIPAGTASLEPGASVRVRML